MQTTHRIVLADVADNGGVGQIHKGASSASALLLLGMIHAWAGMPQLGRGVKVWPPSPWGKGRGIFLSRSGAGDDWARVEIGVPIGQVAVCPCVDGITLSVYLGETASAFRPEGIHKPLPEPKPRKVKPGKAKPSKPEPPPAPAYWPVLVVHPAKTPPAWASPARPSREGLPRPWTQIGAPRAAYPATGRVQGRTFTEWVGGMMPLGWMDADGEAILFAAWRRGETACVWAQHVALANAHQAVLDEIKAAEAEAKRVKRAEAEAKRAERAGKAAVVKRDLARREVPFHVAIRGFAVSRGGAQIVTSEVP